MLVAALWLARGRPDQAAAVLLAVAAGEAEAHLWAGKLRMSGITVTIRDFGDFRSVGGGVSHYSYELWVGAKDEARARKVLGL